MSERIKVQDLKVGDRIVHEFHTVIFPTSHRLEGVITTLESKVYVRQESESRDPWVEGNPRSDQSIDYMLVTVDEARLSDVSAVEGGQAYLYGVEGLIMRNYVFPLFYEVTIEVLERGVE